MDDPKLLDRMHHTLQSFTASPRERMQAVLDLLRREGLMRETGAKPTPPTADERERAIQATMDAFLSISVISRAEAESIADRILSAMRPTERNAEDVVEVFAARESARDAEVTLLREALAGVMKFAKPTQGSFCSSECLGTCGDCRAMAAARAALEAK